MLATGRTAPVEVREGASELEHPMIAARRQTQPLGGVAQQRETGSVRFRDLLDGARRRAGVADDALQSERGETRELDLARRP